MFSRRDIIKCGILGIINPFKQQYPVYSEKEELYYKIERSILSKINKYLPTTKITVGKDINWGFWSDCWLYNASKIGWYGFFRFKVPSDIKEKQENYDKKFEFLEDFDYNEYIENRPEYKAERVVVGYELQISEFYDIIKYKTTEYDYHNWERLGHDFADYCRTRLKQKLISENLLDA